MRHNYIKRLFTALLLFCSTVAMAHDFEVDGIYYNITSQNKTVGVTYKGTSSTQYSDEYSGAVIIPENVTYNGSTYSVTSIGEGAFSRCTTLTSVEIPNSVTSIGEDAFYSCTGLTSVTIPNSVTSIGENAFSFCTKLTSVEIPNSVRSIGESAFSNCRTLTNVHISDLAAWCNIDFADEKANPMYFAGNLYLNAKLVTELVIPEGVTNIKDYVFYNCNCLTSVEIPNSVRSIGEKAFYSCEKLTNVHISDLAAWRNIDFADEYANPMYFARNLYLNAKLVTELVIPEGVTNIKDYVFYNCKCLTSVEIPNSVRSIGESAFYGCTGITSVTIPNSVKSIGNYAFANCSSLTNLHIEDAGTALSFGSYGNSENGSTRFKGCPLVNIYIGRNLSYYYNEDYNYSAPPFSDLGTLRSVIIGDSVTSIGTDLFLNSAIKSIIIGSSVKYIGNTYRTTLEKVVNHSSLYITKGSRDNGGIAYYADYVYNYGTTVGDFVFSRLNGVNYLVAYTGNETSIELPADYNGGNYEIAADAFSGCHQLVSVVIPNSVTSIGNEAFEDCI